jgi:hypothetical protein
LTKSKEPVFLGPINRPVFVAKFKKALMDIRGSESAVRIHSWRIHLADRDSDLPGASQRFSSSVLASENNDLARSLSAGVPPGRDSDYR